MSLTSARILAANDLPPKRMIVPEWEDLTQRCDFCAAAGMTGCACIFMRPLNALERDHIEQLITAAEKRGIGQMENIRARIVVMALCDENGVRLFSDQDAERLGQKSSAVIVRLFDDVIRMNKLRPKDLEDTEKN